MLKLKKLKIFSGIELARAIFKIHAMQKFCLISRGMNNEIRGQAKASKIDICLHKKTTDEKLFSKYVETINSYLMDSCRI